MGGVAYVEADTNADILAHFIIGRLAHLGPQMTGLGISHGKSGSVEKWRGRAYERPWELHRLSSPLIDLMKLEQFNINPNEKDALKKLMKWENKDGDPALGKNPVPWVKHIDEMIDTGVRRAICATMHFNDYMPMSAGFPLTDYEKVVNEESSRVEYGCKNQLVYDGKLTIPDQDFFKMLKAKKYDEVIGTVGTAYSFILMNENTVFGRDPFGFRFLCYVQAEDGTIALSTETRALDMVGFDVYEKNERGKKIETFKHVPPGSIGIIEDGEIKIEQVVKGKPYTPDSFGWDYSNRPDSHLDGVSIRKVRLALGKTMAEFVDFKEGGIVTYPPRSPFYQAVGFAAAVGTRVTNIYVQLDDGREYLQGSLANRKNMSGKKLGYVKNVSELINGKYVFLVDDSIVSGAHFDETASELYDLGADEVHLVITSPPFVRGCPFGAYVPPEKELAAVRAGKRLYRRGELPTPDVKNYVYDEEVMKKIAKEVSLMIGVNSVTYMPLKRREGLYAGFTGAFGSLKDACMYCFGRPIKKAEESAAQA